MRAAGGHVDRFLDDVLTLLDAMKQSTVQEMIRILDLKLGILADERDRLLAELRRIKHGTKLNADDPQLCRLRAENDTLRLLLEVPLRKLVYLCRDYPDDKESKSWLVRARSVLEDTEDLDDLTPDRSTRTRS